MLFYGRMLNMSRQEIMVTRYGEMKDMITCLQIEKGELVPVQKKVKKAWTYEEAMALE
jgi:hypothetical protein